MNQTFLVFLGSVSVSAISILDILGYNTAYAQSVSNIPVPPSLEGVDSVISQRVPSCLSNCDALVVTSGASASSLATSSSSPVPTFAGSSPMEQLEDNWIRQMGGETFKIPPTRTASTRPVALPPPPPLTTAPRTFVNPELTAAQIPPPVEDSFTLMSSPTSFPQRQVEEVLASVTLPRGERENSFPTELEAVATSASVLMPNSTNSFENTNAQLSPTIGSPEAIEVGPEPFLRPETINPPTLQLQGVAIYQDDETSARARVAALYPLTPRVLAGATVDLTDGTAFADSQAQGLQLNELYLATSLENLPNLRFVLGQLDLTSYFDRNSFAKDAATHFLHPVFQTNPALSATAIAPRPAFLVNWSLTDRIETKAAVFSSARDLGDFRLDGFAGEVGIRYGNAIIRGTYATARDAGANDGFAEIFSVPREDGTGILESDREQSFGVNAEVYIPNLEMGIFGRYGQYRNDALDLEGDTFNLGVTFLDVFAPDDRLGLAYGQALSNFNLRNEAGLERPDVVELFYDFRFLPNLRIGFSVQQRDEFSETILGVRVKSEFDLIPPETR